MMMMMMILVMAIIVTIVVIMSITNARGVMKVAMVAIDRSLVL